MSYKKLLIILSTIIILLVFSGCSKKQETATPEPLKNVKVLTVTKSNIQIEDEFAGEIVSLQQVGVVPKIPGKVTAVNVDIGSNINKGDLLFTMDPTDIQAQLNIARAQVESAKTGLKRAQGSGLAQSLIQSESAYEQAKISYDDAKTNFERNKTLYEEGAISKSEYESAQNRFSTAQTNFESSKRNLDLLNKQSGPDSIKSARDQLSQAIASLEASELQLEHTKVYAPVSGKVSKKNINVGEGVSTAAPAIEIVNDNNIGVELEMSEKIINKISQGQRLKFTIDTLQDTSFEGEITNISPAADNNTHFYTVKAQLTSSDPRLKQGMFAKTKLVIEEKNNIITVPNVAIVPDNGVQYTFVINNNIVKKTPVKLGLSNEKTSEIIQGLKEGDVVAIESQNFLADDEKINPIK